MKRHDFLNAIRKDGTSFRVDKISIDTGKSKISGKGTLRVSGARFLLEVTLDDLENVPEIPMGIIHRSQFWKLRGLIEDELEFELFDLPDGRKENFGHHPWKVLPFSFRAMDLVPAGFDIMTTAERKKWREDAIKKAGLASGSSPIAPKAEIVGESATKSDDGLPDVSLDATLRDFELIALNGGTTITAKNDFFGEYQAGSKADTFHGKFMEWRFALIQKENDVDVHFWSGPEYKSLSEEDDRRLFRAFLNAVSFTHGQHAWPFLTEHRRDGKLLLDHIHLTSNVAHTCHAPFSEKLDGNARTDRLEWKFIDPLEKAYRFFGLNSKLSTEVSHLLYLLREASAKGVAKKITLLSLCSLFESLVHVIYEEEIADRNLTDAAAFEAARKKAIEAVIALASQSANPSAYDRITAILTSATALRLKDEFEAVLDHLSLGPKERWLGVFELWRDYRNPLSHRLSSDNKYEVSMREDLLAESKIAGAINCMILKLMGYSGYVRFSAFEDEYGKI